MKAFKIIMVVTAAVLVTFGLSGNALALHDGGVAHCDACHTMHNSEDGAPNAGVNGVGAHLMKGTDPSSTCLNCHAGYGQFSSDGSRWSSGGDYYWVTKDYTWTSHGRPQASLGDSHGHNIIAADQTGLDADATLSTAPGGTYLASQLGCNSCHDPHGKQGNQALLYGAENTAADYPGGYSFTNPAPVFKNISRTAQVSDASHSAYGSGMSEWCANCHSGFYNKVGKHPAGNNTGAGMGIYVSNYNAYVATGDLTGQAATSYWEIVPFETGATDESTLDTTSTAGPTATSNVMCLSCHRAHASPFPNIGRWYFEDTLMLEDSHPMLTDTGAAQNDIDNMWYGRTIPAGQRSFCNKCHIMD